jgi:hypothetical protein
LEALGLLAKIDRAGLAVYCEQFRQWAELAKAAGQGVIVAWMPPISAAAADIAAVRGRKSSRGS